ncbi:oligosaccharide repeat unit polymerase [Labilibacter sediminis]|nr:oligosaccharide repeat unit polymerase [Labilibacter sediminis]
MSILLFNLCLYLIPFVILLVKDKGITLRAFLLGFITFNAVCSVYTWYNGIYLDFSGNLFYNELTVFPFLLIWITLMLVFYPIVNFREQKIERVELPSFVKVKYLSIAGIALAFLLLLLMVKPVLGGIASGFGVLYTDAKSGEALFSGKVYKLYHLYSIIQIPLMLYWGYYICFIKKNIFFSSLLFISAFIPSIIYGVGGASRGMLFFRFIDAFVIVLIFRKFISAKLLNVVKIGFVFFVSLLLFISIVITSDRFGEGDIIFKIIAQYFGESFINANIHFFANLKDPLLGERMFPDFYKLFTGNSLQSFTTKYEAWSYYSSKVGVYIHYFKTLPIDFYIELGVIGAVLSILILFLLGKKYIKITATTPFYRLIWVVYYYQICIGSLFGFTKAGHDNFVRLIGLLTVYLFFRVNFRKITLSKS